VQDMSYEMTGWNEKVRLLSNSTRLCVFTHIREPVPLTSIPIKEVGHSNPSLTTASHFIQICQPRYDFICPRVSTYAHAKKRRYLRHRDPNLTKKFFSSPLKRVHLFTPYLHLRSTSILLSLFMSSKRCLLLHFCYFDLVNSDKC
jgi:hypothetical protein